MIEIWIRVYSHVGMPVFQNLWVSILLSEWSMTIDQYFHLMWSYLMWCTFHFLGTIHKLLLYFVVLVALWLIISLLGLCVLWSSIPCKWLILTLPLLPLFTCLVNKNVLQLSNMFSISLYVLTFVCNDMLKLLILLGY